MLGASLKYVSWLAGLAAIALLMIAGDAWRSAEQVRKVDAAGTEAVARLDGGRRTLWKGVPEFGVNLTWTDQAGNRRTAEGVPVSAAYASEIVQGTQLVTLAAPIKYLPREPAAQPVLAADVRRRAAELRDRMWSFLGLGLACLLAAAAGVAAAYSTRGRRRPA